MFLISSSQCGASSSGGGVLVGLFVDWGRLRVQGTKAGFGVTQR